MAFAVHSVRSNS